MIHKSEGLSLSSAIQLESAFQIRQNGFKEPVTIEILKTLKVDEPFKERMRNMRRKLNDENNRFSSSYSPEKIDELNTTTNASLWDILSTRTQKILEPSDNQ